MSFMNANSMIPKENENVHSVLVKYTVANGLYIADIRDNIDKLTSSYENYKDKKIKLYLYFAVFSNRSEFISSDCANQCYKYRTLLECCSWIAIRN